MDGGVNMTKSKFAFYASLAAFALAAAALAGGLIELFLVRPNI
jgi:hypothetical protein